MNQKTVVDAAILAAAAGNVQMLGKLYNRATDRIQRGRILCLIACEHALRTERPNNKTLATALKILNMGRRLLIDEWKPLCQALVQERIIRRACADRKFAEGLIVGRAKEIRARNLASLEGK